LLFSPDLRSLGAGVWRDIFANPHPAWIEIGPGRGEFLLTAARRYRERNYFAIERSRSRAHAIEDRIRQKEIANARVIAADAPCVLALLPGACVAGYFVQFPDPWWKRRHERRRLWSTEFVAALERTLAPGGEIDFVTDVEEYFGVAQAYLDDNAG